MFENLTTLHYIYIAIVLGITVAIIYTNIQRTALSKFFNALIDKKIFDCDNAKSLSELGISGIYASIVASSAKSKSGAGKYVKITGNDTNNKLEAFLDSEIEEKYYLDFFDTELLIKKYSYSPLSFPKLIGMIAALIVTVTISAVLVDFIIDKLTTPDVKFEDSRDEEEKEDEKEEKRDDNVEDEDTLDKNEQSSDETKPAPSVPTSPTVPTGPSVPTGPKN